MARLPPLCAIGFIAIFSGGCEQRTPNIHDNRQVVSSHPAGSDHDAFGMDMLQSADRLQELKRRGVAGDNDAARDVANHYSQLQQMDEEARWLSLAASRGDCNSILLLRDTAMEAGSAESSAHWNDMLREHVCTRGDAFPSYSGPGASAPLWVDD